MTTVVFDKTGTITHGRPSIASLSVFVEESRISLARILAVVGAAEGGSEHPLAKAMVKFAKETLGVAELGGRVGHFEAVAGCGLRVNVGGLDELVRRAKAEAEELKNFVDVKRSMPHG